MEGERREAHELEFLPAALEVQETPPSPLGRAIAWSLMAFFTLALLWSIVGHVDIVAVAHGKIIPAGMSKVIQPMEIGVVKAIHVEEDQRVKAGDPLVDLDPTMAEADEARYAAELAAARARLLRVNTLLAVQGGNTNASRLRIEAQGDFPAELVRKQEALMRDQYAEYRARIAAVEADVGKKSAEAMAIEEELARAEAVVPIITERVNGLKDLADKHLVSRHDYLRLEQERIEQVQTRESLRHRARETREAIRQARAERDTIEAEFRKNLALEQAELETEISTLAKETLKAETRTGLQRLTAPVDGVVQQMAVHTLGGVVTPAQALMVIVPDSQALEIEAYIENKDIGFVEEGQQAEIKIDAFPFTKYGTIEGKVTKVTNDAIEDEKRGWVFGTRVVMDRNWIDVNQKRITLSPGMAVSIEVKTGTRRLIEYFLSPIMEGIDESVRER